MGELQRLPVETSQLKSAFVSASPFYPHVAWELAAVLVVLLKAPDPESV